MTSAFDKLFLLSALSLAFTFKALGHGEDRLGPMGGYLRMPGAYHTELIPTSNQEIRVRLLDINWQNPSVKNSAVSLWIPSSKTEITCASQAGDDFICPLPAKMDLKKKGRLVVRSVREGQKGNEAVYELPLKLSPVHQRRPKPQSTDHSHQGHQGHH